MAVLSIREAVHAMGRAFAVAGLLLLVLPTGVRAEDPITLRQAVAEALASSPRLRAPDDARTLAEIRERQAASRFGLKATPTFQTGLDPTVEHQRTIGIGLSRRLPTGTDLQFSANSYRIGDGPRQVVDAGYTLGISQSVLRGFGQTATADLKQAQRGVVSAGRAFDDSRQQLVVTVADAYFSVLRASRLVEAASRSLDRAARLRISSEARAKVGLATELDVLRADLLASQAEVEVVAQRESFEAARDSLKTLLGRPAEGEITLADQELGDDGPDLDGLMSDLPQDGDPVPGLVRTALMSRVDVQEARERIGDARRNENVARWNLLPPVTFDLAYTRRGLGPSATPLFGELFSGWRVGLSTSYALDRSDEAAAAASAAVSSRAAERESIDAERRVGDEVRKAYRAWTRTASTIEIQKKAVTLAERQVRLAEIRYERGVSGNFDVVDAETTLFQAQSGLIGAQVERALAALTLRRATGTLKAEAFLR